MTEQTLDIEIRPGEEVIDIIEDILKSRGELKSFDNKSVQLINATITEVRILIADSDLDACISAQVTFAISHKDKE